MPLEPTGSAAATVIAHQGWRLFGIAGKQPGIRRKLRSTHVPRDFPRLAVVVARRRAAGHESGVTLVGVSKDRDVILTASSNGSASLWGTVNFERHGLLRGHTSAIESFTFSQDGSLLLTVARDRTARVCNVRISSGAPAIETHSGKV